MSGATVRRIPANALNLKEFIRRQTVLSLYRDMMRSLKGMESQSKRELRTFIREDFEKNRTERDEAVVKMLIARGQLSLKELRAAVGLAR